ncbi:uncharacterized protein LOC125582531 isoform X2 [Brassica napus]|uniref:uncharacterized protein LOC125582531 isoform X2 n=1 Tax=Brassica napus TaxID=3708 RepID=UPI002078D7F2|nr:uncharacterized protein LOC125582531 isoform X2 [Brassica napus]
MPIIRQKLNPGLQRHEMSLLRLFETVSDDYVTLALIQIKLTDVTDPMVNEKVADQRGTSVLVNLLKHLMGLYRMSCVMLFCSCLLTNRIFQMP